MLLVALALAVLFVWIVRLTSRISDLESREMESSETVGQLSRKLEELAKAQRVAPAAVVASPPVAAPPVVTPRVVASPPVGCAPPVVAPPVVAPPPVAVERPSPRAVPVLDVLAGSQEAVKAEPVPVLAATADPTEPEAKSGFDWEELIGVRLFSWAAGILLALAAVYFLGTRSRRDGCSPPSGWRSA